VAWHQTVCPHATEGPNQEGCDGRQPYVLVRAADGRLTAAAAVVLARAQERFEAQMRGER